MQSLIRVYRTIALGCQTVAEVMDYDTLQHKKAETLENVVEKTEIVYPSDEEFPGLNNAFGNDIVGNNSGWGEPEIDMINDGESAISGRSYSFSPDCYDELNEQIQQRLGLKGYMVGGLTYVPGQLKFAGNGSDQPSHIFLVGKKCNVYSIYVCAETGHHRIARKVLSEDMVDIVGGGRIYTRGKEGEELELVLDGTSSDYNSIPNQIAQIFGDMIVQELRNSGIDVSKVTTDTYTSKLNQHWVRGA